MVTTAMRLQCMCIQKHVIISELLCILTKGNVSILTTLKAELIAQLDNILIISIIIWRHVKAGSACYPVSPIVVQRGVRMQLEVGLCTVF